MLGEVRLRSGSGLPISSIRSRYVIVSGLARNGQHGLVYKAPWRSWLARRPVTAEVAGSSPVGVAGAKRSIRPGSSAGSSVRLKSERSPVRSRSWPQNLWKKAPALRRAFFVLSPGEGACSLARGQGWRCRSKRGNTPRRRVSPPDPAVVRRVPGPVLGGRSWTATCGRPGHDDGRPRLEGPPVVVRSSGDQVLAFDDGVAEFAALLLLGRVGDGDG